MNYLRILISIPVIFLLCFVCGVYSITFLLLYPIKLFFPKIYFAMDSLAVKSLVNAISSAFNIGGCAVYEYGEDLSDFENENCLLLINHQSTVDVPLIMHLLNFRKYLIFHSSWMLDEMFKYAPFGWVSLIRNDIFVKQGRETRNQQLSLLPEKFKYSFSKLDRKWLIIFPEGGFFYKRKESSKAYALKNDYPKLDYVTLPRMGAVDTALQVLFFDGASTSNDITKFNKQSDFELSAKHKIKYIIDITVAYDNIECPPSFVSMLLGSHSTRPVYVYYRVYDIGKIPVASSYELQSWMYKIYKEKNDRLSLYYSTRKFQHLPSDEKEIPANRLMHRHKYVYIGWDSILFSILVMSLWTYLWLYILPVKFMMNFLNF